MLVLVLVRIFKLVVRVGVAVTGMRVGEKLVVLVVVVALLMYLVEEEDEDLFSRVMDDDDGPGRGSMDPVCEA